MTSEKLKDAFMNLAEPSISSAVIILILVALIITIYIFIRNFIEKKRESHRRIQVMSNMDELTHLYKRKFFETLIEAELERAKRHERSLSCAVIEIDKIEEIKEKYGDQFCDSIVQDIGEIFTDDTRIHDICARFGKYSFISLMPESDMDSALFASKRLMGLIQRCKFDLEGTNDSISVTVSIGIVTCHEYFAEELTTEKVFEMAGQALQVAKEKGGDRVEFFVNNNS